MKESAYTLDLSTLHGIASLDNRLVRENGSVLFQYHHLGYDLDSNAVSFKTANFL